MATAAMNISFVFLVAQRAIALGASSLTVRHGYSEFLRLGSSILIDAMLLEMH